MPIQLPPGAIRTALNLKDNPGNLKQEVILCGNIENYFGATGLKSVAYAKIGAKEFGTKPGGSTTTPDTPTTGKGSASDPYTVAEAIAAIKAGAPTYEVYLTGTVSEIDFTTRHTRAFLTTSLTMVRARTCRFILVRA